MTINLKTFICPECGISFERKFTRYVVCCSRECKIHHCTEVDPATGCWNWTGGTTWVGYGQFAFDGYVAPAHRHAYLEFKGPIGPNLVVRHKCDNKLCCNPDHLEIGSQRDNVMDYIARGDRSYGVDDATARAVYNATGLAADIAERFGVRLNVVRGIRQGRTYTHVTGATKKRKAL